jgi:hypothetical protein
MAGPRYNATIGRKIREIKKPFDHGWTLDIVEHEQTKRDDEYAYYVELRIYENEIAAFSEKQRLEIGNYLMLCQIMIQSYNIKCELGGVPGDPPQNKRTKG